MSSVPQNEEGLKEINYNCQLRGLDVVDHSYGSVLSNKTRNVPKKFPRLPSSCQLLPSHGGFFGLG